MTGACSFSPHVVMRELGIPVELVRYDSDTRTLEGGGDFFAINPKGYVPVLELEDGQVLTEGPAIVQYLADRKPEAGLAPRTAPWSATASGDARLINPRSTRPTAPLQARCPSSPARPVSRT